jgi:hypothetical protein
MDSQEHPNRDPMSMTKVSVLFYITANSILGSHYIEKKTQVVSIRRGFKLNILARLLDTLRLQRNNSQYRHRLIMQNRMIINVISRQSGS